LRRIPAAGTGIQVRWLDLDNVVVSKSSFSRLSIFIAMDSPGLLEGRHRIEAAARDGAEELDPGGLRVTEIPEELHALTDLKVR
jgi:hypothetical protein